MCFGLNLPPRAVLVDLPEGGRNLIGQVVVVLPERAGSRSEKPSPLKEKQGRDRVRPQKLVAQGAPSPDEIAR